MSIEIAETLRMADELRGATKESHEASYAQLIARARAGDSTAFDQLMICAQRKVFATAWRFLGNEEDARDATQETFLRMRKYLRSFRPEHDFHAWLYRITINVCRDAARKRRPRDESLSSLKEAGRGAAVELTANANAEESVMRAQQLEMIRRALDTLPEKERAALILRDMQGLSTEEVAHALGSRPATVRSQISTARAKVKTICEQWMRAKGVK